MEHVEPHLRYVQAGRLETPLGSLDGVDLIGPADDTIGQLDGVLIDPQERQLRYFVVKSSGWFTSHHYLVTAAPTRVERGGNALRLDIDEEEVADLPEIEPEQLPPFSDEDLVAAMFSPRPA